MAFLSDSRFAFHSSLPWTFSTFAIFGSIFILQPPVSEDILHNNLRRNPLLMFYLIPVSLEFLGQHFCVSVLKANLTFIPLLTLKKETAFKTMFHFSCILKIPVSVKLEWTSVNQIVLLPLRPALQSFPIRESKITIFTASAAKPSTKQDE